MGISASSRPVVGVLHPGAMGASIGAAFKARAGQVIWAAEGRSYATSKRAELADLVAVRDVKELVACADVVISICPPSAALDVARAVHGYGQPQVYVDVNAVAPDTVVAIGEMFGADRVVDGSVIGPPGWKPGTSKLWLSGSQAGVVAGLLSGSPFEVGTLGPRLGAASALKACFALQSKALVTLWAVQAAAAHAYGVGAELREELLRDGVDLDEHLATIARRAVPKAWRWIGEMDEAAATLRALDLPDGFSTAASEVYRRIAAATGAGEAATNAEMDPDALISAVLAPGAPA